MKSPFVPLKKRKEEEFPGGSDGKESTCNARDLPLGQEDPLEKGGVTHFSILAWEITGTGAWRATVHGVTESDATAACIHFLRLP